MESNRRYQPWSWLLSLGILFSNIGFSSAAATPGWNPFFAPTRPSLPLPPSPSDRSPIDTFLRAEREQRGLTSQPEASREVLLRRVFMDLVGLNPTPEERQAFLADASANAYDQLVDRLLADPRYGERWGRHWMDVWRYSDWAGWTDGGQVRDSKPHIWKWRDWIVESLNADKPYDRMVIEMLAGDEVAPEDPDTLRATGFLVRNYKMLSREQWLEDTVKHTAQAFMGVTMGCAKCHDHLFDPISQRDYYSLRAIFEPHQVRTDRVPGQLNTISNGLARAYDAIPTPTYVFHRGDERQPLTNAPIAPGVPSALGGRYHAEPITLPRPASHPNDRPFVLTELLADAAQQTVSARDRFQQAKSIGTNNAHRVRELELKAHVAELSEKALQAVIQAECAATGMPLPPALSQTPRARDDAARAASQAQRQLAVAEAELKLHPLQVSLHEAEAREQSAIEAKAAADGAEEAKLASAKQAMEKAIQAREEAKKKAAEVETLLAAAKAEAAKEPSTTFTPRPTETFPATTSGRRLGFARWLTAAENPLAARVAVNHLWLRHFGRGLVPSPSDFGRNGRPPTHPLLLDWLATELIAKGWSMKSLHREMVLSAAYRMSSASDVASAKIDPDNHYLWRMNSRRLEAEAVRDNLLHVAGTLDTQFGGPDIDHKLALSSRRRSIYLRHAAEKQAEFLQIFDGPSVTECYERHPSVMPQQALALANSTMAIEQAKILTRRLTSESKGDEQRYVERAFERMLARRPTPEELDQCLAFLRPKPTLATADSPAPARQAERLILVLINHNDFVTVR
ncbi:MAG: DUF1553 domain-containing protein [Verrucomicrobiales bacterium]|nr:DUF1553 domain-containing protein [Verrucomicrobiales bacterium]